MLHDEQLFACVKARIGLDLLVGQRTKFLAAALGEEERAVDDVIRYAIAIPQEAVFWQAEELGFFVAHQQDIMIFKRFGGLNETTHNSKLLDLVNGHRQKVHVEFNSLVSSWRHIVPIF